MKTLLLGLLIAPGAGAEAQPPSGAGRTLYFFFAPDSPGQAELARSAVDYVLGKTGAVNLRSVLLVGDFAALGKVKEESPFTKSLKELSRISGGPLDLAIFDDEGLALAKAWKIERLPAVVLIAEGRAHIATGSCSRPQDLEECRQ